MILKKLKKFYWINIEEKLVWYKFFYVNKPFLVCQSCHHKVLQTERLEQQVYYLIVLKN